jgi:uncharacterized protein
LEIEYDPSKARSNWRKHGVSFEEAATALLDPFALAMEDSSAKQEVRWILLGVSHRARLLTVIYTLRGEWIRLISARRSSASEAKTYAQGL